MCECQSWRGPQRHHGTAQTDPHLFPALPATRSVAWGSPPPLCPRDLVCPSLGLYGGTLLPDPLEVHEPLSVILLPSPGPGKPRRADVLCQGLRSQAWLREKASWKGLCIQGKSAPNNSQIQVQAVQVKAGRKLQPLEAFSPRDLIKAEECWSQNSWEKCPLICSFGFNFGGHRAAPACFISASF